MHKISIGISCFLVILFLFSCNKKIHPSSTPAITPISGVSSGEVKKTDSVVVVKKATVKPKPKTEFPKIITVNDSAAQKSVDGRLYYDVLGHRYWKNYKNGKYYLFNKSMYNDPAFKPAQ
jgi:hypothetical protein